MLSNTQSFAEKTEKDAIGTIKSFSDTYGLTQRILFGTGKRELSPDLITPENLRELIETIKLACDKVDDCIRTQKESIKRQEKETRAHEIGSVYAKRQHTINLNATFVLKAINARNATTLLEALVTGRAEMAQNIRDLEIAYESLFGSELPTLDELLQRSPAQG